MRMLGSRVLIRVDPEDEKEGHIYLPDDRQGSQTMTGVVEAAGPGAHTKKGRARMSVEPGDRVMLPRNSGFVTLRDGLVERVVVDESQIEGVVLG